jgi:hypothetical protein
MLRQNKGAGLTGTSNFGMTPHPGRFRGVFLAFSINAYYYLLFPALGGEK